METVSAQLASDNRSLLARLDPVVANSSIPERLQAVTQYYSQRPAVHSRLHHWTYAELNARANQVAHALLARGFDRALPVAVLLPADAPLIATCLGVLKAGGFYVAIDSGSHPERARAISASSQAPLVLVDRETAPVARVCGWDETALLYLEPCRDHPTTNPELTLAPSDFAVAFYTSGSTGVAKGVVHTHESILQLARNYIATLGLTPESRCSWTYHTGTLGGIRLLLPALLAGACVYPFNVLRHGFAGLRQLIQDEELTVVHLPVTMFRHFVADLAPEDRFPSARYLVLGGESSGPDCLEAFKRHFSPQARLNVGYGSSETGRPLDFILDHSRVVQERVPVGYPNEGFAYAVVDEFGKDVAAGRSGELMIRSAYLARGYWSAGILHDGPFIPCPHDSRLRSFRTGDIAQVNEAGELEILGRLDHRVKIRSLWVDLSTVERALVKIPGIKHAAVVVFRRVGAPDTLAAWLHLEGERPRDVELRARLGELLALDAVPDYFYDIAEFPRTNTGKTDRKLLEAWAAERYCEAAEATEDDFTNDDLEHALTRIWQQLLKVNRVQRDDDFFALGGHSLLAVRVISEIEKQLGHTVPLAAFILNATIRRLARLIEGHATETRWQSLIPIQESGSQPPLFLVHGIGGGVLTYRALAQYLGSNQPVYGLQAVTLGGGTREYDRVEDMARHYVRELRELQPEGPYYLGGLSFGGKVALEMARLLLDAGEQIGLLVLFDTRAPGFPQYLPALPRTFAHVKNLLTLPLAAKVDYVRVRAASACDNLRRRVLTKHYRQQARQGLQQVLDDIGIAHVHAGKAYRPAPYPGQITLLRANDQPVGSVPEPCIGWDRFAADIVVHPVPGHHLSILVEPHLPVLANRLSACLAEAHQAQRVAGRPASASRA